MNKLEALTEIFEVEGIFQKFNGSKIDPYDFLLTISKDKYCLKDDLNSNSNVITRLIKRVFPDKSTSSEKVCTYLLYKYHLKFCPNCKLVKDIDLFDKNKARPTGINTHCKDCCLITRRVYQREYQASRKADKLARTPSWADLEKIKEIYAKCPEGYHVDHVIPLRGELVSGLHVENNLQYLLAIENIKKSNTFTV